MFNGVAVAVGDIVAIKARNVKRVETFHAAVLKLSGGTLQVLCADLALHRHDGTFTESDVISIEVISPAVVAIKTETSRQFTQGQKVVGANNREGSVIAAINGLVAVVGPDGKQFVAHVARLRAA